MLGPIGAFGAPQVVDASRSLSDFAITTAVDGSNLKVQVSSPNNSSVTFNGAISPFTGQKNLVVPSGATLGSQNAVAAYIYVYLIRAKGDMKLAVSASILDEGTEQTTSAISGSSTSATVLYADAIYTGPIALIGRLASTQATAGTYATAISEVSSGRFRKGASLGVTSTITASTTYVVPAGASLLSVILVGGGGGGGGGVGGGYGGNGGDGSTIERVICSVTPGQSIAVTIGAFGAGNGGTGAGSAGGATTFAGYATVAGGAGGVPGGSVATDAYSAGLLNRGGQGGVGSLFGAAGIAGRSYPLSLGGGGAGGAGGNTSGGGGGGGGSWGAGGAGSSGSGGVSAAANTGAGGGGGGYAGTAGAGNGGSGLCIVTVIG